MPLLTPTLSIADNADGSGGVATIAGATPGTTNTVYAAPWSGGFVNQTFASYGSRSGNGTLAVATANGFWWGSVKSTDGVDTVWSTPIGFRTSSGEESVYYRCLLAVAAKIESLALAGITVTVRKLAWNKNNPTPGIFVCPTKELSFAPGTNKRDDVPYGVQVVIVRVSNGELSSGLNTELDWRERISRAFRNPQSTPLAGVDEIFNVTVEPGTVLDYGAFAANYDVQALTINCYSREIRGTA